MPPLKKYVFESIQDAQTEITIRTYGDEKTAFKRLSFHVVNPSDFRLKK